MQSAGDSLPVSILIRRTNATKTKIALEAESLGCLISALVWHSLALLQSDPIKSHRRFEKDG